MSLRHRILFTVVVAVLGGWLALSFAPADDAAPTPPRAFFMSTQLSP